MILSLGVELLLISLFPLHFKHYISRFWFRAFGLPMIIYASKSLKNNPKMRQRCLEPMFRFWMLLLTSNVLLNILLKCLMITLS